MKYSYTLIEAAALWAGINPEVIQERIDATELKQAELAHEKIVSDLRKMDAEDLAHWEQQEFDCASCSSTCPVWKTGITEDELVWRTLQCNAGYSAPFSNIPPEPRSVPATGHPQRRTTPHPGEFPDLPEFEERFAWLSEATTSQDLPMTRQSVRGSDLRAWMSLHFPHEHPNFLFPDQANLEARLEEITSERDDLAGEVASLKVQLEGLRPLEGKSKSSYLSLVGAFLALLATEEKNHYRCKDEQLREALLAVFGDSGPPSGLSKSFLESVFGAAKKLAISRHPKLKDTAFPRS